MKSSTAKKSLGAVLVCATVLVPAIASANYPPVPKDLGTRVETPVLSPKAIGIAALLIKPGTITIVVDPNAKVRSLSLRATNKLSNLLTSKIVHVRKGAKTVTVQVDVPAGDYRVRVDATLSDGFVNKVTWICGVHKVVKAKK